MVSSGRKETEMKKTALTLAFVATIFGIVLAAVTLPAIVVLPLEAVAAPLSLWLAVAAQKAGAH